MKLEIGKKYNTKGGWIVEVFEITKYTKKLGAKSKWGDVYYNDDGTIIADVSNGLWTIISEVCDQK